ncbi:hypothetical protein [Anaerococcus sp. AGMB09787]|uniref:hypothetical protein n=1 Tax=Anaerococcus sp. AGMB09787 TaxID=2922869 RepID=UPI001FAEF994|nr:hypothetical protein [Anaerococcus sp. AGMB09787]
MNQEFFVASLPALSSNDEILAANSIPISANVYFDRSYEERPYFLTREGFIIAIIEIFPYYFESSIQVYAFLAINLVRDNHKFTYGS